MTVKEIVIKHLKENGYGGLCHPDGECACLIDDLGPCDGSLDDCEAGYKIECDGECGYGEECDWHIVREKPKPDKPE